jgi:GT2 family glycosyltransferase
LISDYLKKFIMLANLDYLVTINILSFNRKEELRHTLMKVYEQNYKNIEVIVVDNASSDGSTEMVEKEFPEVKIIRMDKNVGVAGWNEGFKVANGDYILVLDDDAYPDKDSIALSLNQFNQDEDVAAITFNLIDTNTGKFYQNDWLPKNKKNQTYWPIFIGCAFIVKVNSLSEKFNFPEDYFIYQHELPMAAEIYLHNKKILFSPDIIAFHNFKEAKNYNAFNDSLAFKNNLRFICTYVPKTLMILYLLQSIFFYFSRSLRHKWFIEYLKIVSRNKFFYKSKTITLNYFLQLRSLHLFNYPLLSKILK